MLYVGHTEHLVSLDFVEAVPRLFGDVRPLVGGEDEVLVPVKDKFSVIRQVNRDCGETRYCVSLTGAPLYIKRLEGPYFTLSVQELSLHVFKDVSLEIHGLHEQIYISISQFHLIILVSDLVVKSHRVLELGKLDNWAELEVKNGVAIIRDY